MSISYSAKKLPFLVLICILLVALTSCTVGPNPDHLSIHIIDVGQGDSILVITPGGKTLLIDGGDTSQGKNLLSYLKKQGVKKIDVLIATHPHSDHIGGLPEIITHMEVGEVYMPQVVHTTKTFENLLTAIEKKNLKVHPLLGNLPALHLDEEVILHFLSPLKDYGDALNLWSIVTKLDFREKSFLFTSDTETVAENDMLNYYSPDFVRAHFFQVPHHGSTSSASERFLDAVLPDVAVISVGKDNPYGHPHREIIERLKSRGILLYRTDQQGSLVFESDGYRIWTNTQPLD